MWILETKGPAQVVTWRNSVPENPLVNESRWVALDQLIGQQPKGYWVVDISGERLLTSEALAIIVGLVSRINAAGGRLNFVGAVPSVASVMKSMRLDRLLSLHENVAGACVITNP